MWLYPTFHAAELGAPLFPLREGATALLGHGTILHAVRVKYDPSEEDLCTLQREYVMFDEFNGRHVAWTEAMKDVDGLWIYVQFAQSTVPAPRSPRFPRSPRSTVPTRRFP